jgi:hypothetical protein
MVAGTTRETAVDAEVVLLAVVVVVVGGDFPAAES